MRTLLQATALAALLCSTAFAAKPAPSASMAQYQAEVARCNAGQSGQSRTDCLREAGAALQEARRGELGDNSPEQLARNRTLRCNSLPDSERSDCLARMSGRGSVSGSVEGGGVLRELHTRQVGDAPPVIVDNSAAGHSPK